MIDVLSNIVIATVFCFGLLTIAYLFEDFFLLFIDGVVWVFAGILVYIEMGVGWTVISTFIGLYVMLTAGFKFKGGG